MATPTNQALPDCGREAALPKAPSSRTRLTTYRCLPDASGAIWSTPKEGILDFPAHAMVRFFENHALLGYDGQHQWYTVQGGSIEYVRRLGEGLFRRGVDIRVAQHRRARFGAQALTQRRAARRDGRNAATNGHPVGSARRVPRSARACSRRLCGRGRCRSSAPARRRFRSDGFQSSKR